MVNLQGFSGAFAGEVFTVGQAVGLVVNLSRDRLWNLQLGGLMLQPDQRVAEGASVVGGRRLPSLILGDFALAAILDSAGNVVLNQRNVDPSFRWTIESPAPGIIDRQSVFEPLQTGLLAIDRMIPVGRGQRELVVGDRQTGKTSIGLDTILNQRHEGVACVFVPVGQKAS